MACLGANHNRRYESALAEGCHTRDIVVGAIRICYHKKSRSYILPGGELASKRRAQHVAQILDKSRAA